jgi:DNA excision repair protein ERCC-5
MGVTSLWTIVHPCARPIKIETLNKKRLAVDASIWIYQFLKAVRDKEGNQLRNSHVVGFFRRICKLLFVGIQPVFVFDGGAPSLKRQTINNRKKRREGRREDAAKTAGKLLALQMQKAAEEEERLRKQPQDEVSEEAPLPKDLIYADEVQMSAAERQRNRHFRKTDAYHLPDLEVSMAEMGQPNDPRVMSLEELQRYASQFNQGEDINLYDFSKIDFDGMFFQSLPPADQYNILNAARLRSRLRMGYSKDQLDTMFPDRMAFSKFQIDRVKERNMLTQRLMRLQGMTHDGTLSLLDGTGRVAGDRDREYVLVKNDGIEGGWILGVVTKKEGTKRDKPIDVDGLDKPVVSDDNEEADDENEFEDVPIEGLNRLPKQDARPGLVNDLLSNNIRRRRDFYKSRNAFADKPSKVKKTPESLFVGNDSDEEAPEAGMYPEEEEDLQRAIALSLQNDSKDGEDKPPSDNDDDLQEVFAPQRRVEEPKVFTSGSGLSIAHSANARASRAAIRNPQESSDEEDFLELQRALKQSKQAAKHSEIQAAAVSKEKPKSGNYPGFDGPLPFEQLDLGFSLFDKKKPPKADENAGGFISDENKKKQAAPLPPWFSGENPPPELVTEKQKDDISAKETNNGSEEFVFQSRSTSTKKPEIIDLEADDTTPQQPEVIVIDDDVKDPGALRSPISNGPQQKSNNNTTSIPKRPQSPLLKVSSLVIDANEGNGNESEDDEMEWEEVQTNEETEKPSASGSIAEVLEPTDTQQPGNGLAKDGLRHASPPRNQVSEIPMDTDLVLEDDAIKVEDHTYSDAEDDELFRQIAQEEQEHERFTSALNNRGIETSLAGLEEELKRLRTQQKKDRRDADEVTQTMITECQQLLALFGLPFITAPMEAEAQCAELVRLGLVDGVVTDDSDIFLFGGTRVYKNMFNQAKVVECYLANDLVSEFGLDRDRLISIAQLLGSDYTEGLPGVGPVTALEIISAFDSLTNFRDWFEAVQKGTRSKADDAMSDRSKFHKYTAKISLPPGFPNPQVAEAYHHPEVDSDPSAFVWGVPDLNGLRAFLSHTIGWSLERTDEVLVPVIRDMNNRQSEGTQSNITAFFGGSTGAGAFAPRQRVGGGSKRLRTALKKIGQLSHHTADSASESLATTVDSHAEDNDEEYGADNAVPKKRIRRKAK